MDKNEKRIIVFIEDVVPNKAERALAEQVKSKCFRTLLGVSDMSFIEPHTGAVAVDMDKLPKGAKPLSNKAPVATPPALRPGLPPPVALVVPGVTSED